MDLKFFVLLQQAANDQNCLIKGPISRLSDKRSWKQYWCVIKDNAIFFFKASHDIHAIETLSLVGYTVTSPSQTLSTSSDTEKIIQLIHPGQPPICFQIDSRENYDKWLKAFEDSSKI